MRRYLYRCTRLLSRNRFIVYVIRIVFKITFSASNYFAEIINQYDERQVISRLAGKISDDRAVIQGPFQGQKFARTEAVGSAYLPKLLGTYEYEIFPVWTEIQNQDFSVILDIGCAEGFYVCALANMFPASKVLGFDLDANARDCSIENAKANGLNNVSIHGACDTDLINNTCQGRKAFILCDIEGAEKELFSGVNLQSVQDTHILIELHDGVDRSISSVLKSKFIETHDISSFYSTDDIHRPKLMASHNVPALSEHDLYLAMREKRGHIMEWVFLAPKLNVESLRE